MEEQENRNIEQQQDIKQSHTAASGYYRNYPNPV